MLFIKVCVINFLSNMKLQKLASNQVRNRELVGGIEFTDKKKTGFGDISRKLLLFTEPEIDQYW